MKKILLILTLFLLAFLFFRGEGYAQENGGILVVTVYETREDIDILFENSLRVLEYLEGVDVEEPIFLSLVSDQQIKNLQDNNLDPQVIDDNADLDSYILLYNPLENQGEKLSGFGEPIEISKHYTLLKLSPGQEFSHEGEGVAFFDIPFQEVVVTPPLRTKTATEAIDVATENEQSINPVIFVILAIVIVGLGIGAFFFIRNKRNGDYQPQ